ncbi:response regulator [Spirosoma areae]
MNILIADDHPMLIDGLKSVLEELDSLTEIGSVTNGRQLIDRQYVRPADLVLLDLNMPRMDGITTLDILTKRFPQTKVIVFTSYNQPKLIRDVQELGAKGYLLKTSDSATLKKAILTVAAGGEWFPDNLTTSQPPADESESAFVDDFMQKYQITKREVEVIRFIANGLTTKQISDRLSLSEFTVNAHRRNITRKTGIDTPVGLLNFAREQGLL